MRLLPPAFAGVAMTFPVSYSRTDKECPPSTDIVFQSGNQMKKDPRTVAMIQYILFTMLVVATPFVVVTKFLQGAVYAISHMSFTLLGHHIPFVAAGFITAFVAFLIWQRRNITPRRMVGSLIIVGMIALSQNVQDLYGGMSLYDLQRNWHYVAYSAYVYFFFRAFNLRNMPQYKAIVFSFLSAVGLSLFDELFQFFMSNRVFDVSDIAKDSWGCMMGLMMIFFVSETYGTIKLRNRRVWRKKILDYFRAPLPAMVMIGALSFLLIMISPLLTDHDQVLNFSIVVVAAYIVIFAVIHFTQYKPFRIAFISLVLVMLLLLSGSIIRNRDNYISHNSFGLLVYSGIPVPFFDLLIYPNGYPRLVDKKHFFNSQDKKFFLELEPSILLIGSGTSGNGGKGFNVEEGACFIFNQLNVKATQVIILETPEACKLYNRLRKAGKKVLFVIHSTC